jgi:hypothetical protein
MRKALLGFVAGCRKTEFFSTLLVAVIVVSAALTVAPLDAAPQRGGRGAPPPPPEPGPFDRLATGTPDMNGVWSVRGGLADITGNITQVGGQQVEGDDRQIPYTPVYAQLRAESDQRMFEEPELHCYMSGVPSHMWRQSYLGAGLVIQHTPEYVVFLHEFQGSRRIVPLDGRGHVHSDIELFMGDGVGHWEGDTLVIETTNNNAITWLDNNGDRHSNQLTVVERFTPINQNDWSYQATFTDPAAYTTSWTIEAPMSRGNNPNAEILEFACVEGNTDNLHYTEDVGGTTEQAPSAAPEVFEAPPQGGGRGGPGE